MLVKCKSSTLLDKLYMCFFLPGQPIQKIPQECESIDYKNPVICWSCLIWLAAMLEERSTETCWIAGLLQRPPHVCLDAWIEFLVYFVKNHVLSNGGKGWQQPGKRTDRAIPGSSHSLSVPWFRDQDKIWDLLGSDREPDSFTCTPCNSFHWTLFKTFM